MPNTLRKKNILYITYSLNTGGLEKLILGLAKRIDRRIFSPSICALGGNGTLQNEFIANKIPVFIIEKKEGLDLSTPFKLAGIINKQHIDILHTNDAAPWLYGGLTRLLCPWVKLVHTEHLNVAINRTRLIYAEKWLARISHAVVSDSEYVAKFLRDRSKINQDRIKVIYNGVDIDKFNAVSNDDHRQERTIKIIGMVSRLVPQKDHSTLLMAFRLLTLKNENIELLIVGDGELRSSLEETAKKLGISQKVKFLGEKKDIEKILQQLDVFVLSSLNEGLPVAILEAMASALPVVATEVGGNAELILHGRTGLLVPPRDPEKLAEAIKELLSNKEKSLAMGRAGRQRIIEFFGNEKMADEYQAIYKSLS